MITKKEIERFKKKQKINWNTKDSEIILLIKLKRRLQGRKS